MLMQMFYIFCIETSAIPSTCSSATPTPLMTTDAGITPTTLLTTTTDLFQLINHVQLMLLLTILVLAPYPQLILVIVVRQTKQIKLLCHWVCLLSV